ncbi:hypothetical protein [Bacillus phage vB_Bpu_PumA2]|uniref:Uncharacterized protein n=1 Tax=Bacillus phage vB_Bpu_PumA2 TaxID=2662128 RepID=A0A5Q2W7P7_9CAUD|nr:hypothetical protein H3021_gp03 [Bacillus phage vB_Bpu_PumA2]QGH74222.1 hypothetical protein [Bacillus phage vB_Bpu_PumA2]
MYILKNVEGKYLFDFGLEWAYWTDEQDAAYKMERLLDAEMTQKVIKMWQDVETEIVEVKK